jgi:G3E family GTPase
MNHKSKKLKAIPTNIISGFLGVGKTTAILSLLNTKPQQERWAVLVNEFGEIGLDGELFQQEYSENSGVFIREVPGGCMCCAAGLPMSVALNQLLSQAVPQRLLIEPTGLGHPKEVLEILCSENYRDVLDIQNNITLVDARKLTDPRYTNHDTFNQQIDIADIIVANKCDLYKNEDKAHLEDYVIERKGQDTKIIFTEHGSFEPILLQGTSNIARQKVQSKETHQHELSSLSINHVPIPDCGYLKAENIGEDFHCVGWRFSSNKIFKYEALSNWLNELKVERIKAILITDKGVISFNKTDELLTQKNTDNCIESRIEIISRQIENNWESRLMECLITNDQSNMISANEFKDHYQITQCN